MNRGTYLEINLNKLKLNAQALHQKEAKPLMAIVKANAYGLGAKPVAQALESLTCVALFGVATVEEAIELRRAGIEKDIFILGPVSKADLKIVKANQLVINLFHEDFYHSLNDDEKDHLRVHIKVNTGMNRLGFKSVSAIEEVLRDRFLQIEGIFTHYTSSDQNNESILEEFNTFKSIVNALNYPFQWIHASNSGASLHFRDDLTNLIRPGIALYGEDPRMTLMLEPVVALYSTVIAIQSLKKGETVGYNRDFRADEAVRIAILPIGYADGFLRSNQGGTVEINGRRYLIVGHICMDQLFVLIDDQVKIGDPVELFGEHIRLQEVAERNQSITYEMISILSSRIHRIYIGGSL